MVQCLLVVGSYLYYSPRTLVRTHTGRANVLAAIPSSSHCIGLLLTKLFAPQKAILQNCNKNKMSSNMLFLHPFQEDDPWHWPLLAVYCALAASVWFFGISQWKNLLSSISTFYWGNDSLLVKTMVVYKQVQEAPNDANIPKAPATLLIQPHQIILTLPIVNITTTQNTAIPSSPSLL